MKFIFSTLSRLTFLIILIPVLSCEQTSNSSPTSLGWNKLEEIIASVKEPAFPENTFKLVDFGGVSDGITDNKPAFDSIINFCAAKGGGKIVVGPGIYLINGPIHLQSNINLHLEEGARIVFGTDPVDYLPVVLTRRVPAYITIHLSYMPIELKILVSPVPERFREMLHKPGLNGKNFNARINSFHEK